MGGFYRKKEGGAQSCAQEKRQGNCWSRTPFLSDKEKGFYHADGLFCLWGAWRGFT